MKKKTKKKWQTIEPTISQSHWKNSKAICKDTSKIENKIKYLCISYDNNNDKSVDEIVEIRNNTETNRSK